jgi:serine phosphatase RsbU (regulator of sigma subunit)
MEGLKFRGGEVEMRAGDILFLYTDGVTEATNEEKQLFGEERMINALNSSSETSVKEIDETVRKHIDEFVGDSPQFDDITMLTIRYQGAEGDNE